MGLFKEMLKDHARKRKEKDENKIIVELRPVSEKKSGCLVMLAALGAIAAVASALTRLLWT